MSSRPGILWRALFLSSSWTWCIGMWFPVYMVKDWGWPGWAAFIVPNAIGAALVGAVHSAGSSPRFIAANLAAMRAFSIVTILFHVSWLAWLLSYLFSRSFMGQGWIGAAVAAGTVLIGVALSRSRGWAALSIVVYLLSLTAFAAAYCTGSSLRLPMDAGEQARGDLLFALPVLVLGFGLCPHLDLTFHRVCIESGASRGARAASFALAFGLCFPVLMVFTLLYAGGLVAGSWSLYLIVHFAAQAAFTIGAHGRELRAGLGKKTVQGADTVGARTPSGTLSWGTHALVAGGSLMFASVALPWLPAYHGTPATRVVYEGFMSFYALVFPAYVWIVAIERGAARERCLGVWGVACVLAAPCLWMGYIEREYAWLVPAAGIVLFAPLVVRKRVAGGERG